MLQIQNVVWRWIFSVQTAILLIGVVAHLSLASDKERASDLLAQATRAAASGDSKVAVDFASQALAADEQFAEAFYLRGREQFRLGKFRDSVADFDAYVKLRPDQEPRQWERGIALYYTGEFERGAKQFELYQTFDARDVENSTWRYLCMSRSVGVAKAREAMLPIENDLRVPMMKIFNLYRGRATVDEVLDEVKIGQPPADALAARLFYAHLYIGLYYEVGGEPELAKKYILLAADKELRNNRRINTYMWDVARVHAERLQARPR